MASNNVSIAPCLAVPVPPSPRDFILRSKECRYSQSAPTKPKTPPDCEWAYRNAEVQKASVLAHVCLTKKPKYCRIKTNIRAILQNGPTCGLTALSMITGGSPTTDDILKLAKQQKFTNHGEMFCVRNLKELAAQVFDSIDRPVTIDIHSGKLDCDHIKTELKNGACLLVAYDSDFNHSPCLKNGHKAHWTVIIGCLVDDKGQFHVFGRHGKTRNLALWSLTSLSASNANLNEYTAPHRYDEYSFQMPVDGIAGENGLRNQCIIIKGIASGNDYIFPDD